MCYGSIHSQKGGCCRSNHCNVAIRNAISIHVRVRKGHSTWVICPSDVRRDKLLQGPPTRKVIGKVVWKSSLAPDCVQIRCKSGEESINLGTWDGIITSDPGIRRPGLGRRKRRRKRKGSRVRWEQRKMLPKNPWLTFNKTNHTSLYGKALHP